MKQHTTLADCYPQSKGQFTGANPQSFVPHPPELYSKLMQVLEEVRFGNG